MHDQESSFSPKLTMLVNFYCHMQLLSDKKIRILNFYFLCELVHVKESFFSVMKIPLLLLWQEHLYDLVYIHGLLKGPMWCHNKDYYSYFANPA